MEILNGLVLVVIAVFAAGCVSDRGGPQAFAIRRLEKGSHSGVIEPRQVVNKDEAGWRRLWGEHQPPGQPARPLPEIDFTKEMVILVAMGQRFSGGFTIEIEKVETSRGRLTIFVRPEAPPPGAMVTQALTAPFEIVAVPRSDSPPQFVESKEVR